jgi:predicted patatin/cPLA2 family phospholipase
MFPVFHIGGEPYLDGGISDGIPFERALEQGCERIIVVLTKPRDYVRKPDRALGLIEHKDRQWPAFCRTMRRRAELYNRGRERLFQMEREGKLLVIAPESTRGVSRTERDVEKLRLLWADGYQQATERMEEIRRFIG